MECSKCIRTQDSGLRTASGGQAAAEYAVALCFVIVLLAGVPNLVLSALAGHYQEIVSLLALPIP